MSTENELIQIFQKNLLYFEKFYPDLHHKLLHHNVNEKYELVIDDNGFFNIELKEHARNLFSVNPEIIAQAQVDNFLKENNNIQKNIFVGTLLGFQIEKLILQSKPSSIMIIEPDIEIFKLSSFLIDYEALTKERVAIFSIHDTQEILNNKILEFIYTMFYKNNNITFLKASDNYQPYIELIQNVYKENILYDLKYDVFQTPKLKKTLNLSKKILETNLLYKKKNYNKAIPKYLEILEYEQLVKATYTQEMQYSIYTAYLNLGNIFYAQRNISEAYHCYGKCLYSLHTPKNIYETALHNYVLINSNANKNFELSKNLLDKHIQDGTQNLDLISMYAELLYSSNEYDLAQQFLKPYLQRLEEENYMISMIPRVPIIYSSQAEIDNVREKLERRVDELLQKKITVPLDKLLPFDPFYLAYHNRNNKNILTKISQFYEQISPKIAYTAPHCKNYKFKNRKIKLAVISKYLIPNHPVLKFMKGIISGLTETNNYDIHILSYTKETLDIFPNNTQLLTGKLQEQQNMVAGLKLDIIIYPEVGMHSTTAFLAHARLAPLQCMFGGHPYTSGIRNMDYYFSQKDLEVKNAQEHYSETLVLFNNFVANYNKPVVPQEFTSKEALGLFEDRHNYLIPAKLQKIHPDFDEILYQLTKSDKKANLIFFKNSSESNWDKFVKDRLLKQIPEKYITFLPWADSQTFYSLLHHADAVLEPTVFGYGTTAIEAFSIGTPIVALPGNFPAARITSAFYKKLSFYDLIATDKEDYVTKTIMLASNQTFKQSCKDKILESNHRLYEDCSIVEEMNLFFKSKLL